MTVTLVIDAFLMAEMKRNLKDSLWFHSIVGFNIASWSFKTLP